MTKSAAQFNSENLEEFISAIFQKHEINIPEGSTCMEDMMKFVNFWKYNTEVSVIATVMKLDTMESVEQVESFDDPHQIPEHLRGKAIKDDKAIPDACIYGWVKGATKDEKWFKTFEEAYNCMLKFNSDWEGKGLERPPCFGINFEFGKGYSPRAGFHARKGKRRMKYFTPTAISRQTKHIIYLFDERYDTRKMDYDVEPKSEDEEFVAPPPKKPTPEEVALAIKKFKKQKKSKKSKSKKTPVEEIPEGTTMCIEDCGSPALKECKRCQGDYCRRCGEFDGDGWCKSCQTQIDCDSDSD